MNISVNFSTPLNNLPTVSLDECKTACLSQCKPFIYTDAINNYIALIAFAMILIFIAMLVIKMKGTFYPLILQKYPLLTIEGYYSMIMVFLYISFFLLIIFLFLFNSGIRITDFIKI